MKTSEKSKKNENIVVWAIMIIATIFSIISVIGLECSKGGSVWSIVSAFGVIVGPGVMLVCMYFLATTPFAFVDYKSKTIWSKETGELMTLILSTGEKVIPETTVSSYFELSDFLWKNHRSELTIWGKICYFMNQ